MLHIPSQIGPYNIQQFQRKVRDACYLYTAHDIRTDEIIDLKVINKSELEKFSSVEGTLRILQKLQKLDNESIIPVMKVMTDDYNIYVAQECLPNGTLAQFIHTYRRKIKMNTFMKWAKQILEGIQALHSIGLVVNDIRMENIGLDIENHIRINDFALTQNIKHIRCVDDKKQSPIFLAPELIDHQYGTNYSKADMWSFGIMMHHMVTGQYPFNYISMKMYCENIDNPMYYQPKCKGLLAELMTLTLQINPIMRCAAEELLSSHIFADEFENRLSKFRKQHFVPMRVSKTMSRISIVRDLKVL